MKQVVITLLALLAINCVAAQSDLTAFANKRTGVFTENLGQILDQNGNPVPDVLAKGSLPGLDIYFTKTGLTYALLQYEEDVTAPPHPVYVTNNKRYKVTCSRVDVELAGAVLNKEQLQFAPIPFRTERHLFVKI